MLVQIMAGSREDGGWGGGGEVVKAKKQLFKPLILQGIDCYW